MGKLKKAIKKHWIVVWFVIAVFFLSTITASAIYTRITIAKRVVSTQTGVSGLFSSDYLSARGTKTTESTSDTTQNYSVDVHVYNYVYPKEAVYKSDATQYDLVAKIGTVDENEVFSELIDPTVLNGLTYSITYNGTPSQTFIFNATNGTSHTFNACEIPGNGAHFNTFSLVFDKSEIGETPHGYCIQLTATPYNNELPIITGIVNVKYAKQATTGWKGELEDIDSQKSYDGYNYYLDGNGKGKLTFKWKKDKVTINKNFLNNPNNVFYYKNQNNYVRYNAAPVEANLVPDAQGYVSLTIDVNSSVQNRYEIQYFKVNPSTISYSGSDVSLYLPNTISNDWEPETE